MPRKAPPGTPPGPSARLCGGLRTSAGRQRWGFAEPQPGSTFSFRLQGAERGGPARASRQADGGSPPRPPNTHQPFPFPRRASRGQRGGWDFRLGVWLWVFCSFPPSPALWFFFLFLFLFFFLWILQFLELTDHDPATLRIYIFFSLFFLFYFFSFFSSNLTVIFFPKERTG